MAVVNKIGKVMKRNHALVSFDQGRVAYAIRRAARFFPILLSLS